LWVVFLALPLSGWASTTCPGSASATHLCVTHDGVSYVITDSSAPGVAQKMLTLSAGTMYQFEGGLSFPPAEPLIITRSATGGISAHPLQTADGVDNPNIYGRFSLSGEGDELDFVPRTDQIGQTLYYQSMTHTGMGATLAIVAGAALPSDLGNSSGVDGGGVVAFKSGGCDMAPGAFNTAAIWGAALIGLALSLHRRRLRVASEPNS